MELKDIESYYKNISDGELIQIAANSQDLKIEAIPLLYNELSHRNFQREKEQVNKTYFLLEEKMKIRELIFERLKNNKVIEYEPIELQYNDKISSIFKGDDALINCLSEFILDNNQIENIFQRLNEVISLQENDVENIRNLLKKKGKKIILKSSIVTVFFLFFFLVVIGTASYYSSAIYQLIYLLFIFVSFVIGAIQIVKGVQLIRAASKINNG
ncbi:MAG: hypothetical protein LBN18_08750 [Dysgonamonadaceae bacterium]|jgi:ABC-type multidrug transport system fused ATPase/permease subunit|nr:hypothetical protein [Dysgonamonadaceae bacterium]